MTQINALATHDGSVSYSEIREAFDILVKLIIKAGEAFRLLEGVQVTIKAQPEDMGCLLIVSEKPLTKHLRATGMPREKIRFVSEFVAEHSGAMVELLSHHSCRIKEAFEQAKEALSASNAPDPER
jgi:hypothetical protein